jgi:hypothetical protein
MGDINEVAVGCLENNTLVLDGCHANSKSPDDGYHHKQSIPFSKVYKNVLKT